MILEANTKILTSLSEFYQRLLQNRDFPLKSSCSDDVASFVTLVNDLVNDAKMQISRVRLLIRIIVDRKSLMSAPVLRSSSILSPTEMVPNSLADVAASSEPDNGDNGEVDSEHA